MLDRNVTIRFGVMAGESPGQALGLKSPIFKLGLTAAKDMGPRRSTNQWRESSNRKLNHHAEFGLDNDPAS